MFRIHRIPDPLVQLRYGLQEIANIWNLVTGSFTTPIGNPVATPGHFTLTEQRCTVQCYLQLRRAREREKVLSYEVGHRYVCRTGQVSISSWLCSCCTPWSSKQQTCTLIALESTGRRAYRGCQSPQVLMCTNIMACGYCCWCFRVSNEDGKELTTAVATNLPSSCHRLGAQ